MRIGHVSDIHLRHHLAGTSKLPARRSREAPGLMRNALRSMRSQGVDVVAVTGDIVDIPARQPSESRDAYSAAVADDYTLCRDILSESGIPYVIVPGNHDDPSVMGRIFATGTGFRDLGGLRFVSFWDREHEGHVPRRVDAELALLEQMQGDEHFQVHLQHFVLTLVPTTDYPYMYDDHEELLRRIVESGRVRLSLSGHYHEGTGLTRLGDTYFSTVPALTEHPHRFRTYDVAEASIKMCEHSVGS